MRIALITGITGQTGSYLAELLLEKGYVVYGIIRRHSTICTPRIDHIFSKLNLRYGDMTDSGSLTSVFNEIVSKDPERFEIYNMAAQSHVKVSFEMPGYTTSVNYNGVVTLLDLIAQSDINDRIRFYQASTSEMYGSVATREPQTLKTPLNPMSPYAVSKVAAHYLVNNYRKAYDLFLVSGVSFNHDSPRRGETFVTRKITIGLNKVIPRLGEEDCQVLTLGNIYSMRDITHAKDIAKGIYLSLQYKEARDWLFATGRTYTIKDFIGFAANYFGKEVEWSGEGLCEIGTIDGKKAIQISEKYYRPSEVEYLCGDASETRELLGWNPTYTASDVIGEMMESDNLEK